MPCSRCGDLDHDDDGHEAMLARVLARLGAVQGNSGADILGGYIKNCVRGRQIICRDRECFVKKRCKRFPAELLPQS